MRPRYRINEMQIVVDCLVFIVFSKLVDSRIGLPTVRNNCRTWFDVFVYNIQQIHGVAFRHNEKKDTTFFFS